MKEYWSDEISERRRLQLMTSCCCSSRYSRMDTAGAAWWWWWVGSSLLCPVCKGTPKSFGGFLQVVLWSSWWWSAPTWSRLIVITLGQAAALLFEVVVESCRNNSFKKESVETKCCLGPATFAAESTRSTRCWTTPAADESRSFVASPSTFGRVMPKFPQTPFILLHVEIMEIQRINWLSRYLSSVTTFGDQSIIGSTIKTARDERKRSHYYKWDLVVALRVAFHWAALITARQSKAVIAAG